MKIKSIVFWAMVALYMAYNAATQWLATVPIGAWIVLCGLTAIVGAVYMYRRVGGDQV